LSTGTCRTSSTLTRFSRSSSILRRLHLSFRLRYIYVIYIIFVSPTKHVSSSYSRISQIEGVSTVCSNQGRPEYENDGVSPQMKEQTTKISPRSHGSEELTSSIPRSSRPYTSLGTLSLDALLRSYSCPAIRFGTSATSSSDTNLGSGTAQSAPQCRSYTPQLPAGPNASQAQHTCSCKPSTPGFIPPEVPRHLPTRATSV